VCVCVELFVCKIQVVRAALPSVSWYGVEQRARDIASVCVFIALVISKNNILVTLVLETLNPGVTKLVTNTSDG
jgi:diacylglycerol kinase